jgi:hypothetical protein
MTVCSMFVTHFAFEKIRVIYFEIWWENYPTY